MFAKPDGRMNDASLQPIFLPHPTLAPILTKRPIGLLALNKRVVLGSLESPGRNRGLLCSLWDSYPGSDWRHSSLRSLRGFRVVAHNIQMPLIAMRRVSDLHHAIKLQALRYLVSNKQHRDLTF